MYAFTVNDNIILLSNIMVLILTRKFLVVEFLRTYIQVYNISSYIWTFKAHGQKRGMIGQSL